MSAWDAWWFEARASGERDVGLLAASVVRFQVAWGRAGRSRWSSAGGCARARRSPSRRRWHRSARRESARGLVFEIADRELDDGVLAMLGLDGAQLVDAVGDERKQLP